MLTARAIDDLGGATAVGAGHRRRRDRDGGRRGQLRPGRGQRQHQLRQLVGARTSSVGTSGNNRWTYLRFSLTSLTTIQAAKLRLFGNLSAPTATIVRTQVFSSTNLSWGESSITWNNKPSVAATVLASATLVNDSTTGRWYEWDLTAFLQAEKAAGRTAVTLVLKDDVATTQYATFRSRQASSNRPELRITP